MLLAVAGTVSAQEETNLLSTRATSLVRKYLRPSLTRIYLLDGSRNAQNAAGVIQKIDENNMKFDKNKIDDIVYNIGATPDNKEERDKAVNEFIAKVIAEKKIGNQIVKCFFPEFKDGAYTVDKLFERGEFAATDNDVLQQNASARQSLMANLGQDLIDRSYVIFYLIKDKPDMNSKPDSKGNYPTYVNVIPYVYKLDFNEVVRDNFYTNFYDKADGIEQCEFPVSFIMNAKSGITSQVTTFDEDEDEQLFTIMRKVSDFQAKAPVVEKHPVRAKIGKKEGVSCDKRYVVMENRMDKNENVYAKRIATLRATNHIADNFKVATGNQEDLTEFYYIKGGHVQPGMTIVENPDFGIGVGAYYNIADISAYIDYRVGKFFGVPGLLVGLKFGLAMDEKGSMMKVLGVTKKEGGELTDIPVMKGGLTLAKEFNFAHNFSFTPTIGAGILWPIGAKKVTGYNVSGNTYTMYHDLDKMSIDSYFVDGAVRLGYYATRNVLVFAEAGYGVNILGDEFKIMRDFYALDQGWGWDEGRDPMALRLGAGVKVTF